MALRFGHRHWMGVTVLLVGVASACGDGSVAGRDQPPCKWTVSASRRATPTDRPYKDHHPLLKDPENPNRVQGPDNVVAVVKSDSLHHPQIYLEDLTTGERRHLIRGSKPRWSPDGTKIACKIWRSLKRPWVLCIVDVKTGKAIEPDIVSLAARYQWSPDGQSIAVTGTLPGRPVNVLSWVHLTTGESRMLDTLPVFGAYENLAWSPNSRALVVSRISAVDALEEATAADLWIFDERGNRCALTTSQEFIEEHPNWINDHDILTTLRSAGRRGQPSEDRVLSVTQTRK